MDLSVPPMYMLMGARQAEKPEEGVWNEPPGFYLVPLPFADDIRAAPIEEACRGYVPFWFLIIYKWFKRDHWYLAQEDVKEAARAWITKLCVKNGTYPPDSYPNPGELITHAKSYLR
jgi:ATP-dependent DNA helicase 2 subunit 1